MPPLFPVTTVGSWPRSARLLGALRRRQRGQISADEFDRAADQAVLECLAQQEEAGVDLVTDGEQRRDNFYSFVADKLEGVQLMSLAQMLDVVEDKAGFERILSSLDVPAYSIHNPTCVGRIRPRQPLALDEYRFLRSHTRRPIKIPLPGPYLLTRAMWVREVSQAFYSSKEELGQDVVALLRGEAEALAEAGVDFIQFDEPVLTELVFTQGQTRTFMCAALAARRDPAEELEFAVSLINQVVEGLRAPRVGLHVCRGNWSTNEAVLLEGSYAPLLPYLERLKVGQLVLEYATPRAGDLSVLANFPEGKELGLGVVNPRTPEVETVESIVGRVEQALQYLKPEAIHLNPDCGFGTFASRPMNPSDRARAKLEAMVSAAERLRAGRPGA